MAETILIPPGEWQVIRIDEYKRLTTECGRKDEMLEVKDIQIRCLGEDLDSARAGLEDLIKSCQAIIDNRHEDLGEREEVIRLTTEVTNLRGLVRAVASETSISMEEIEQSIDSASGNQT